MTVLQTLLAATVLSPNLGLAFWLIVALVLIAVVVLVRKKSR